MKKVTLIFLALSACWSATNTLAQLEYSTEAQTTTLERWKFGFPEFTNAHAGVPRYYRQADHTEVFSGKGHPRPNGFNFQVVTPFYEMTNAMTLGVSGDDRPVLTAYTGWESYREGAHWGDSHVLGLSQNYSSYQLSYAGQSPALTESQDWRPLYIWGDAWAYSFVIWPKPDLWGPLIERYHCLDPWAYGSVVWTNHACTDTYGGYSESFQEGWKAPLGWQHLISTYGNPPGLWYSLNETDGTSVLPGSYTLRTVYTNSISPTDEHDYHWASLVNSTDARFSLTGSCYTVTSLSTEFKTADLLSPFDCETGLWFNMNDLQMYPESKLSIRADQSDATLTSSRLRFKLRSPKGEFPLTWRLHVHFDANSDSGITDLPALDLNLTNSVWCYGNGQIGYYPMGKPFELHPPYVSVVSNDFCYYYGGEADLSLLDYLCIRDGEDQGLPRKNLDCASCVSCGMPSWWVTEPYLNLWAADQPVQYTTSLGEQVGFAIRYKQRDTRPTSINGTNAFVPITGWNHNWFSYIHFTGDTEYDYESTNSLSRNFSNWTATVYRPGGGEAQFSFDSSTDPATGDRLMPLDGINSHVYLQTNYLSDGAPRVYGAVGFRLVHTDGSQDIYGTVTDLYPTNYTTAVPGIMDDTDTGLSGTVLRESRLGFVTLLPGFDYGTSYRPYTPSLVAAYTNEVTPAGELSISSNWSGAVFNFKSNTVAVTVLAPPASDAVLTEHIDPYGNSIHFYYSGARDTCYVHAPVRLQSVRDYDGVTTSLTYDTNGYLSQVWVSTYARSAQLNYSTNGLLKSVTDAQYMTSTFDYDSRSNLTAITTPYGTTGFTHYETNAGSGSPLSGDTLRALVVNHPDSSHAMYAFFGVASNSAPQAFQPGDVPDPVEMPNQVPSLDTGSTDPAGAMFARNSFYWGPAQFARLSDGNINLTTLRSLTANDFRLARLSHWALESDGATLSSAATMTQDPSPDGASPGQRTWYCYGYRDTSSLEPILPWQLRPGSQELITFTLRRQPDGSTWCQETDYDNHNQLYSMGLSLDGASDRGFSYNYEENHYTNQTPFGEVFWSGSRPSSVRGPGIDSRAIFTWSQFVSNRTVVGDDGVNYSFTSIYPYCQTLEITSGAGDSRAFFNTRGQVTGRKLSTGLTVTYNYGANGFLSSTVAQEIGATNTYTFYRGLPRIHTDPLGLRTLYTWDNLERLTTIRFPDSTTINNVYNRLDLTAQKDRLGHWSYASYDSMRRPTSTTDRNGNVTHYDYCTCGGLDSITDPLNNATLLYRDLQGRPTNIVYGTQGSSLFAYDLLGRVTGQTNSSGLSLAFSYDYLDHLTQVTSPAGQVYAATYSSDYGDRPVTVTDADGIVTASVYDTFGRLTERYRDLLHQYWHYDDGRGVLDDSYDPYGRHTYYGYDAAGRRNCITNANGDIVQFGFGRAGELLSLTNENGAVTCWGYDIYGRQITKINGNGQLVETNAFDANDRVTAHWTPAKGSTHYTYDNNGNCLTVTYSSGPGISATYDGLNRRTSMSDAVGRSTFTYQNFGAFQSAPATETSPWGETVSHTYQNGELASTSINYPPTTINYAYDSQRRLQTITSPAGQFSYNFTGAGSQIQSLSLPGGSGISYGYDAQTGQLTSTALANADQVVLDSYGYSYDDHIGLRNSATRLDNSTISYGYDSIGQLTSATAYGRHNEQFGYRYDPAGNLINRTNDVLLQSFSVDLANQLTNIDRNASLTYAGGLTNRPDSLTINGVDADVYDNLTFASQGIPLVDGVNYFTTVMQTGSAAPVTSVLTNNLPASVNLAYDLNGNLTSDGLHSYEYDCANELTSITVDSQFRSAFVYDGFGRRRIRREYAWATNSTWRQTSETRYVYDGMQVLQERDQNGTPKVTYTRGLDLSGSLQGAGGIGGLLARTDGNGSAYYFADGNGNITAMVDGQGKLAAWYLYDPFGNLLNKGGSLADANLYRFSSKEAHVLSGLCYYGFRFFDPTLQRWLNQDPIGEAGGINQYRFALNSGVSVVDKDGRIVWFVAAAIIYFAYEAIANAPGPEDKTFPAYRDAPNPIQLGTALVAPEVLLLNGAKDTTLDAVGAPEWTKDIPIGVPPLQACTTVAARTVVGSITGSGRTKWGNPHLDGKTPQPGTRTTGVKRAARLEVDLVKRTGNGTTEWTKEELQFIKQNDRLPPGTEGHHINNVDQFPDWAGDPRNIKFVRGRSGNIEEHDGAYQNPTIGPLIER